MPLALQEVGLDHRGQDLPDGICACVRKDTRALVAFKVRWYQEDDRGYRHQSSKSFSVRKLGSPDRALDAATFFLAGAAVAADTYRRKPRRRRLSPTTNDVFAEWLKVHGVQVGSEYIERATRLWEKDIAPRPIGKARLDEISADPAFLVHSQDELIAEGMKPWKRRELWKLFQAVLRWAGDDIQRH
jgi:hypothetical protein